MCISGGKLQLLNKSLNVTSHWKERCAGSRVVSIAARPISRSLQRHSVYLYEGGGASRREFDANSRSRSLLNRGARARFCWLEVCGDTLLLLLPLSDTETCFLVGVLCRWRPASVAFDPLWRGSVSVAVAPTFPVPDTLNISLEVSQNFVIVDSCNSIQKCLWPHLKAVRHPPRKLP